MSTESVISPTASEFLSGAKKMKMNSSINDALTEEAGELGLYLSSETELGIMQIVRCNCDAQWLEQNAKAISAYNERITAEGLFGDSARTF